LVHYDDGEVVSEDLRVQRWRFREPSEVDKWRLLSPAESVDLSTSSVAVFGTAWLCAIARSRLALEDSCFTPEELAFGTVDVLVSPLRESARNKAHSDFFSFLVGPARTAFANATVQRFCLRISTSFSETYEIAFRPVARGIRTVTPNSIGESATCAIRALRCYLLTLDKPIRTEVKIDFSAINQNTKAPEVNPDCETTTQVSEHDRVGLGTFDTLNCTMDFGTYTSKGLDH
jgi:hypothetical protein